MLEPDWLKNVLRCAVIFRETHSEPGTVLHDHVTLPNYLSYFKDPYSKRTKTHNDTGQTNKYSKQRDNNNHIHVFATKFFIMYGKHILYLSHSLSLTDSRGGHTALFVPLTSIHTHANESDWKRKPVRKVLHFATFQSSNLVNSGLWIRITCDHR